MTKYKLLLSAAVLSLLSTTGMTLANDEGNWNNSYSGMHSEHHHFLSEEQRKLLHETKMNLREKDKAVFGQMRELHKKQKEILKAETFNKQAYLSVTNQINRDREQLANNRAEAFASIADKFTPEERNHVARKFGRHHHHHHKHHHHHHHWQEGGQPNEGWHKEGDHDEFSHDGSRGSNVDQTEPSSSEGSDGYPPYQSR